MRPNAAYKSLKKALFSVPMILVLAVITAVVGVAAFNMHRTYEDTRQTVKRLQEERQQLADRKQAARSAAARIATRRGLKEEIREKFSVAKPGERVIVLTEGRRRQATSADKTADTSWWGKAVGSLLPF